MGLIKKDVSDSDIENLFDNNNTEGFVDESDTSDNESLIPSELDVNNESNGCIKRPDYTVQEVRQKKLNEKKQAALLKNANEEKLLQTSGSVSKDVFNEIAKARQKAQLEEFVSKQRKLPQINPSAKYKLYSGEPDCNFHVYQPLNSIGGGRFLCTCKFCSQEKIFTEQQWKNYEIENREYM